MSRPRNKKTGPELPGQTKTMFITEGNPMAVLVTDAPGGLRKEDRRFDSPEAALAWCRQNRANFYYTPGGVTGN